MYCEQRVREPHLSYSVNTEAGATCMLDTIDIFDIHGEYSSGVYTHLVTSCPTSCDSDGYLFTSLQ